VGITFFHILAESFGKMMYLFQNNESESVLKYMSGLFLFGFCIMLWLDKLWFARYHDNSHHSHQHHQHTQANSPNSKETTEALISNNSIINGGNDNQLSSSELSVELQSFAHRKMLALGTLIAFSFHSFLEGIALGTETPDLEIIGLIIVFSFHKALDGLAVTLPLSRAKLSLRLYWTLVFVFCSMTPLGLISAYTLMQPGGPLTKFSGLVEATSGGIFMYISLFHIFMEELENNTHMIFKLLTFTASVLLMFLIESIT